MNPANLPLLSPGMRTGMVESLIYMFDGQPFTVRHIKHLAKTVSNDLKKVSSRGLHDSIHQTLDHLIDAGRVEVLDHHAHRNVYRCTFRPSESMNLLKTFLQSTTRTQGGDMIISESSFLEFLGMYTAALT